MKNKLFIPSFSLYIALVVLPRRQVTRTTKKIIINKVIYGRKKKTKCMSKPAEIYVERQRGEMYVCVCGRLG